MQEEGGARITVEQDQAPHKDRLYAYSRTYDIAANWRNARIWGNAILAIASLGLALSRADKPEWLGVIAAVYLIVARTLFRLMEDRARRHAARLQELYDTGLFRLPWNPSIAGARPLEEDVADASIKFRTSRRYQKNLADFDRWYDLDLTCLHWPLDVLMCQRYSASWARGDHRVYGALLVGVWVLLVSAIVIISVLQNLTVRDFLVLFLPLTPALLDIMDAGRTHVSYASAREVNQRHLGDLFTGSRTGRTDVTESECRQVQDAAFTYRMTVAPVPSWFYKVRREISSRIGKAGARQLRDG